jgi:hypothetical protein
MKASLTLLLALLGAPAIAAAQDAPAETTTTTGEAGSTSSFAEPTTASRPFYVGGGIGGSFGLNGPGATFKLQEEVGYQFDPIPIGGGLDILLRLGGDFSQQFAANVVILEFDARFSAAFLVWDGGDIAIRVAPSLALGAGVTIVSICTGVGGCSTPTNGAFDLQFGGQGELEVLDGMLSIWFRPIAVDLLISSGTLARWDLLAGVDVHL